MYEFHILTFDAHIYVLPGTRAEEQEAGERWFRETDYRNYRVEPSQPLLVELLRGVQTGGLLHRRGHQQERVQGVRRQGDNSAE